jgi:hypothetical protein
MSDKGPELEGIWAAVIIAVLIIILRVFAKIKINRFFVDDVLIVASVCTPYLDCSAIEPYTNGSRLWQLLPPSSLPSPCNMALENLSVSSSRRIPPWS